MTKISITIEADNSRELQDAIMEMAAGYAENDDAGVDGAEVGSTVAPKKQRRGRTVASVTPVSSDPASTEPSPPAAGSDTGPTAPTAASPSDDGAVTKEVVAARMQAAMAATSPAVCQAALQAYFKDPEVKSLSKIPADRYAEALTVFDGIIATA